MNCTATRLPYRQTSAFSKIALDYIDQADTLRPFFLHPPSLQGITKAIEERKNYKTNREILVQELKARYENVGTSEKTRANIELLLSPDTFTVTTAHQNNLFTGPLYFIYKIIHAIKLADWLKESLPEYNFVPLFYIGSEDADLEELNHIYISGEKLTWHTQQTGAVGRMKTDKELLQLISAMEGQLLVLPHGKELVTALKENYREGVSIAEATFGFVNFLFAEFGLVILQPDNARLKKQMAAIFRDDLLHQSSSPMVEKADDALQKAGYKVQAHPREINLFYLSEGIRNRIEKKNGGYRVVDTSLFFTAEELLKELDDHPERFSPNVILRGLYEETILPNIVFIGGGGEMAYWMQLKGLFDFYKVPYPVLVLRNSFLLLERRWQESVARSGLVIEDFFLPEQALLNKVVLRESPHALKITGAMDEMHALYDALLKQVAAIDVTLEKHVEALRTKAICRLQELEKKMLRAEKRKYADRQRQLHSIRSVLFPGNGLQERTDNICYYYAKWGRDFLKSLYQHSLCLEQEFVILSETGQ
ncbi:MAG TPA: bacillithiol biosynthesis cysteine-adding enzyme BshC [Chitinophagaceae bacterium]|nr:bacillithiol biosynthesis cysteine-adding enzyme BshC [Chitinophagaceae bacterium]